MHWFSQPGNYVTAVTLISATSSYISFKLQYGKLAMYGYYLQRKPRVGWHGTTKSKVILRTANLQVYNNVKASGTYNLYMYTCWNWVAEKKFTQCSIGILGILDKDSSLSGQWPSPSHRLHWIDQLLSVPSWISVTVQGNHWEQRHHTKLQHGFRNKAQLRWRVHQRSHSRSYRTRARAHHQANNVPKLPLETCLLRHEAATKQC